MNAAFQPELILYGVSVLADACRLETMFEFTSAEDIGRGTEVLAATCEAFAAAGALGGYAMAANTRQEAMMAASAIVRVSERQACMQFSAANTDPKAFQYLRNMLSMLVACDARLERICITAQGSQLTQSLPVRVPLVDERNESVAYPATAVTPEVFDLVWSDSQFSKSRRVIVEFRQPPPTDLPARLGPYVQAWFDLLEKGAFCAPFGLPFETESIGGRLSLFDETSYEISIARFVASEAGFRVLANMLGHFSKHVLAIASIEID
jgi:hypothetical protein